MGGLVSVGYFLFSLFFSLVIFVLWVRIALRYHRVSALHPVIQTINTLSSPVINPVNRLFGWHKSPPSRYDRGSFLVLVIVEFIKISFMSLIFLGGLMPIPYLILYVIADLIIQPCNLLFYAIIIRVVLSWVNPGWRHPLQEILFLVTEPLFRRARQIIPPISGIDLSPILILLGLKIITIFIQGSLPLKIL